MIKSQAEERQALAQCLQHQQEAVGEVLARLVGLEKGVEEVKAAAGQTQQPVQAVGQQLAATAEQTQQPEQTQQQVQAVGQQVQQVLDQQQSGVAAVLQGQAAQGARIEQLVQQLGADLTAQIRQLMAPVQAQPVADDTPSVSETGAAGEGSMPRRCLDDATAPG